MGLFEEASSRLVVAVDGLASQGYYMTWLAENGQTDNGAKFTRLGSQPLKLKAIARKHEQKQE